VCVKYILLLIVRSMYLTHTKRKQIGGRPEAGCSVTGDDATIARIFVWLFTFLAIRNFDRISPLLGFPEPVALVARALAVPFGGLLALFGVGQALEWFGGKAIFRGPRSRLSALRGRRRMAAIALFAFVWATLGAAVWWWGAVGVSPAAADAAPTATAAADLDVRLAGPEKGESYLAVENRADRETTVWADVRIFSKHEFRDGNEKKVYDGYWENAKARTTKLLPSQRDRLVLGGVGYEAPPINADNVHFVFYDPQKGGRSQIG
jgi:hypothetical protein